MRWSQFKILSKQSHKTIIHVVGMEYWISLNSELKLKFVLHLHGHTVCVKVKWMFPDVGLGSELKITKLNHWKTMINLVFQPLKLQSKYWHVVLCFKFTIGVYLICIHLLSIKVNSKKIIWSDITLYHYYIILLI